MSACVHRPDTLYVAAYIKWSSSVIAELTEISKAFREKRDPVGSYFRDLIDHCEDASQLVDISVEEAYRYALRKSQEDDREAPVCPVRMVAGQSWQVAGWSVRKRCHLTLENGLFRVHVRLGLPSPQSPNLYLEIGSKAFWSAADWRQLLGEAQQVLAAFGASLRSESISRLDLAHHTQAVTPHDLKYENFISPALNNWRAEKSSYLAELEEAVTADAVAELIKKYREKSCDRFTWHKNFVPQQISFGQRGTSAIHARIYVKSREVAHSSEKKALFRQVWEAAGFSALKPVVNIEFELCREALRDRLFYGENGRTFKLESINDLLTHYNDLRAFLIGSKSRQGWLRMIKNDHSRRTNCTIDDRWQAIREGLEVLGAVQAARVARDVVPAKLKELQRRMARTIVWLLKSQGRVISINPESLEVTHTELMDVLAESMAQFDHIRRAAGESSLIDHVLEIGTSSHYKAVDFAAA